MTAKTVAIGVVLVLAGCSNLLSGNADTVSLKVGIYSNPGPKATEHCARYGKSAFLENVAWVSDVSIIYIFKCQ